MTEAFTILLDTTRDGQTVRGAGAMRVTDGIAQINGQQLEVRRISLDLLVAVAPSTGSAPAPTLLIEGRS